MRTLQYVWLILVFFGMQNHQAMAQQAASVVDNDMMKVRVESVNLYDNQGIPFLKWDREVYNVENATWVNYANIRGKFTQKIESATVNAKTLSVSPDGSFNVRLEYAGKEKSFIITVIDQSKKLYRMQYKLSPYSTAMKLLPDTKVLVPFRWRFSAGAGFTSISYRQRNVISFDQMVITLKAAAVYRAVPGKFDLGLSAFFNALPLSSNSTEGYKIQYLGVNFRGGLHLTDPDATFRVVLNGGFYFNTSYGTIGFSDMYGPQIFPEFLFVFPNGNTLYNYWKYSYSLSNTKGISLKDNREVATGIHYSFPINPKNRLSLGVDLSQLSLSLEDEWATTNTYTFSAGLSF